MIKRLTFEFPDKNSCRLVSGTVTRSELELIIKLANQILAKQKDTEGRISFGIREEKDNKNATL